MFEQLIQVEKRIDEFMHAKEYQTSKIDLRNNIFTHLAYSRVNDVFRLNLDLDSEGYTDIFVSIYTNCSNLLSLEHNAAFNYDNEDQIYNEKMLEEIKILAKYKMLFNILPLFRRDGKNIYDLSKVENSYTLTYQKEAYFTYECYDTLLTRINLIVNFNNIFNNGETLQKITKEYFRAQGFFMSYNDQVNIYKKFIDMYLNKYDNYFYLLSNSFILPLAGFTLHEFKMFFSGVYVLNQISTEMLMCFLLSNPDLRKSEQAHAILMKDVLNKKHKYLDFKNFFCNLTSLKSDVFEKIIRYFMCDLDSNNLDLSGDDYITPFLKKDNLIYFNTSFSAMMVSPRNLLYALNNQSNKINKDGKYDNVSKELEINFIKYMEKVFKSHGFESYSSIKWKIAQGKQGEIDLVVVCEQSQTILCIQTKTVIAASNYRSLFSLQDSMSKAVEQIKSFNNQSDEFKYSVLRRFVKGNIENYNIINGLNSDGGIGNAILWEIIFNEGFIPFNVGLLMIYFNTHTSLENFKEKIYSLIDELNSKTNPKLKKCEIDFTNECLTPLIIHDSLDADYFLLKKEMEIIAKKHSLIT